MGNGEMENGTVSQFPEDVHFPITQKKISDIVLLHLKTVISAWGLYGRAISSISL